MQWDPTDIILTATRRLATRLKTEQLEVTRQPVELPQYIAYTDWIHAIWRRVQLLSPVPLPNILSAYQEKILWENIIETSSKGKALLHISATASLVAQAWKLCQQWRLDPVDIPWEDSDDHAAFYEWAMSFRQFCTKNHWIDSASIPNALIQNDIFFTLPCGRIFWIGFDDLYPQIAWFFSTLKDRGYDVAALDSEVKENVKIFQVGLSDPEDEIKSAIRWAKNISDMDESANVAIVIQDIESHYLQIQQIAVEIFYPERPLGDFYANPAPRFHISSGVCLRKQPLIYYIVTVLSALSEPIKFDMLAFLIRSPFITDSKDSLYAKAKCISDFRNIGKHAWEISDVLSMMGELETDPRIVAMFEKLYRYQVRTHTEKLCSDWKNFFVEFLFEIGWPGDRILNTEEYQVISKWEEILEIYQTLDPILGRISWGVARKKLDALLLNTLFQTQDLAQAKVHILGLLEVGGQKFSHLWVTQMSDDQWPGPACPNPFLSYDLQKKHQMAHSSPERELDFSKNVMRNFEKYIDTIVYSYPSRIKDKTTYPSALIRGYPLLENPIKDSRAASPAQWVKKTESCEEQNAMVDTALPFPEKTGVRIFELQSQCPFKAFAVVRLGARENESPTPYLRPSDRGTLTHHVMSILWKEIKTSKNLQLVSKIDLADRIKNIMRRSRSMHVRWKDFLPIHWIVEEERMVNLLLHWFDFERRRDDFFVRDCEASAVVSINGKSISVRIDRIDLLSNGAVILIDYKTKNSPLNLNEWLGVRPEQPQMLVYALAVPEATGVAYAQLASHKIGFLGVSEDDVALEGIKLCDVLEKDSNWAQLKQQWRQVLESLLIEFDSGNAAVDPRNSATCQYCHLQSMCRIKAENYE